MLTLSIVIPVYNEDDHIIPCLEAIAAQTVIPDEVIVVDNNSTDRTAMFAEGYSFVKVISQPLQGIAHARNAGFDMAQSTLIGRIDADTVLPETWVENILIEYRNSQEFALTGGGYFYNVPLQKFNGWALGQLAYRLNRFIMGHYIVWGSNMVITKSQWQAVQGSVCSERSDIHEDLDLSIHLHQTGIPIVYHEYLNVGVEMKRIYSTDGAVHKKRMDMWPNTLYAHNLKRAWLGKLGAWGLYQGRFVIRSGNAVATAYRLSRKQLQAEWVSLQDS